MTAHDAPDAPVGTDAPDNPAGPQERGAPEGHDLPSAPSAVGRAVHRVRAALAVRGRSRGSRRWWWRGAAPVGFALAGTLFVTSWSSSGGTDLRGGRYDDLPGLAAAETRRLERLRAEQEDLAAQVNRLTEALGGSIGAQEAQAEARRVEAPAGLQSVSGPGITVTLDDAPESVQDSVVDPDELDNLVVHQQDIQAVVNALWDGGAEAMTIQGQRVISTTGIRCVGNTVVLHDVPYAPPYVIQAIGPVDAMLDSVNTSPYVDVYFDYVAAYQLGWSVGIDETIEMPAYAGSTELTHARPIDEDAPLPDDRT